MNAADRAVSILRGGLKKPAPRSMPSVDDMTSQELWAELVRYGWPDPREKFKNWTALAEAVRLARGAGGPAR